MNIINETYKVREREREREREKKERERERETTSPAGSVLLNFVTSELLRSSSICSLIFTTIKIIVSPLD